jgi:hypothetical protein
LELEDEEEDCIEVIPGKSGFELLLDAICDEVNGFV